VFNLITVLYLSFYLFVSRSVCPIVHLFASLLVLCLFIFMSVSLFVCSRMFFCSFACSLLLFLFVFSLSCLFVRLQLHASLFICLFVSFVSVSVSLFVCLSVRFSICLFDRFRKVVGTLMGNKLSKGQLQKRFWKKRKKRRKKMKKWKRQFVPKLFFCNLILSRLQKNVYIGQWFWTNILATSSKMYEIVS
jgi:hypothetical protein